MRSLALLALAAMTLPGQVMQWTRYDTELTAVKQYSNGPQEVTLDVEFRSPSGKRYTVPAFWDGGALWRARFSPNETGPWSWTSRASIGDTGLNAKSGSFECVPYNGTNMLYRHGALRIANGARHFEHADGTPFFWLGDTVWNGPLLADVRDWNVFLRDRAQKGFNVIQVVTTKWSAAHGDASGRVPYTGADRIQIDPTFFRRLDQRMDAINEHGLIAAPVLLWAHTSQPAMNPGVQLPEDQMILLARYIAARYGAHQVVWFLNGDGRYVGEVAEKWKRVGRAVFAGTHPQRLASVHPGQGTWMTDTFIGEPWFSFTGYQSGHRDDDQNLRWFIEGPAASSWRRERPVPELNIEPNYEAHLSRSTGSTLLFTNYHARRAGYWSVLISPPAGVTYGAHGIWSWEAIRAEPLNHKGSGMAPPWNEAMKLPGSSDMMRLKALMTSLPWTQMLPAQETLTAQPGVADPRNFVAVSRGGGVLVAYLPMGGSISLTADGVNGATRARWYNPRDGQWRNATLGSTFHAPDKEDWILVLDSRDLKGKR